MAAPWIGAERDDSAAKWNAAASLYTGPWWEVLGGVASPVLLEGVWNAALEVVEPLAGMQGEFNGLFPEPLTSG